MSLIFIIVFRDLSTHPVFDRKEACRISFGVDQLRDVDFIEPVDIFPHQFTRRSDLEDPSSRESRDPDIVTQALLPPPSTSVPMTVIVGTLNHDLQHIAAAQDGSVRRTIGLFVNKLTLPSYRKSGSCWRSPGRSDSI